MRLALSALLVGLCAAPALAAGNGVALPAAPLPPAVAKTRDRVIAYARAGRYEDLARIAHASRRDFTYHFGFETRPPAAYWRAEAAAGRAPLPKLVAVLSTPPAAEAGMWVWPAAAVGRPAPAAWEALKAVYPASRVARYRREGYTGWRAGIDDQGEWKFFLHKE